MAAVAAGKGAGDLDILHRIIIGVAQRERHERLRAEPAPSPRLRGNPQTLDRRLRFRRNRQRRGHRGGRRHLVRICQGGRGGNRRIFNQGYILRVDDRGRFCCGAALGVALVREASSMSRIPRSRWPAKRAAALAGLRTTIQRSSWPCPHPAAAISVAAPAHEKSPTGVTPYGLSHDCRCTVPPLAQ